MADTGLTAEGYIAKTATELYNDLETEAIASVSGFTGLPADLRENLIQTGAIVSVKMQDMVSNMLNGIGPDFANDFMFIQLGNAFGLQMKNYQYASVTIEFTGTSGTIITTDIQVTNSDGSITVSPNAEVTIGTTGVASVLCYTSEETTEEIPADTMTVLTTANSNITAVNNPNAGTSGLDAETIDEFKERVYTELQSARNGTAARCRSLLSDLDGVETRLMKFNETSITVDTYVYKGIEVIVGGGDDAEVAGAIFQAFMQTKNLISDPSDDDTSRTVTQTINLYNSTFEINYTRPKEILLGLTIEITFSDDISTSSTVILSLLQPEFEDFFDEFTLGQQVNKLSLNSIVMSALEENSIEAKDVQSITYTVLFDSVSTSFDSNNYLPIEADEYLTLDSFAVSLG